MSVHISHLSKKYGTQNVLDDVSFVAEKGQITGFLGPNGAGKSTTMKIATGYVPANGGTVTIAGTDIAQNPLEAQRKIGYLPEHNPLYLDMYVHEYLEFISSIYKLKDSKSKVASTIERVGLSREQGKKILALSKGYRQRVGLAQALIHDPEVLILDEPLTGLDPNQIVEIRNLIKELGENKTVIFSTHIMQEVQSLCDKVVIIHKGKIVADKSLSDLKSSADARKSVQIELAKVWEMETLHAIDGILEIVPLSPTKARIYYSQQTDIRPELFKWASEQDNSLLSLMAEEDSLESIFQKLTIG
jgi:ABC-2 type transport system ATP-binding protein